MSFRRFTLKRCVVGSVTVALVFVVFQLFTTTPSERFLPVDEVDSMLLVHFDRINGLSLISSLDYDFYSSFELPPVIGSTDTRPAKTAVFVLFDSTSFDTDVDNETVGKWPELNSALTDCRHMTSSERCRVYFLFYKDDERFTKEEFLKGILLHFYRILVGGDLMLIPEYHPELFVTVLSNRSEDARLLGDAVKEVYLGEVEYFYFIPSLTAATSTVHSHHMSISNMEGVLRQKSPVSNVGVVFQTADGTDAIVGLLCNEIHLEIFGEMFPYDIATFTPAIVNLVGMYSLHFSRRFSEGVLVDVDDPGVRSDTYLEVISRPPDLVKQETIILERYLDAIRNRGCIRCNLTNSRNIIAMSLYGSDPRYTMGALRNAQLLPVIFPNWRLWFYTEVEQKDYKSKYGKVPPQIISKIKKLGAEIRHIDPTRTGLAPMLWRFMVAEDRHVDLFTVRDSDSRLTPRDAAVVADWLKSGKAFHCIRDHPSHSKYPVSGGLWGGRRAPLDDVFNGTLKDIMKRYGSDYVEDMNFLGADVWPVVKDNHTYCHDSFSCESFPSSHPFPVRREGYEHIGQVYDHHSIGREMDMNILSSTNVNTNCTPT